MSNPLASQTHLAKAVQLLIANNLSDYALILLHAASTPSAPEPAQLELKTQATTPSTSSAPSAKPASNLPPAKTTAEVAYYLKTKVICNFANGRLFTTTEIMDVFKTIADKESWLSESDFSYLPGKHPRMRWRLNVTYALRILRKQGYIEIISNKLKQYRVLSLNP